MFSGLDATQKDDYPITVMTGHSLAEVIVSREPIEYTAIDSPDYFLALSEDGLKRAHARIEQLPETCILYAEESLELPDTKAKIVRLPLAETARKISKLSVAIVAPGALLQDTGLFPVDALGTAISRSQKPKIAESNLKALEAGAELVSK